MQLITLVLFAVIISIGPKLAFAEPSGGIIGHRGELRFPLECQFIKNQAFDTNGAQAGHFGGPAALHAREIHLIPLNSDDIRVELSSDGGRSAVVWIGKAASCRDASKNMPLPHSVCFDLRFSRHPQSYSGQLVLSDTPVIAEFPIEMNSVGQRTSPKGQELNVVDQYWCRLTKN